jgi:hypothetical protein
MPEPIDGLFSTAEMSAAFSSQAHVRGMLAFEAALARAEARAGIIPLEAAAIIEANCREELFDVAELYREVALAGTPAIPLVGLLAAHVEGDARKFVHWGATSQDAFDTALMLQMKNGLDLLVEGLFGVCAACAALAQAYTDGRADASAASAADHLRPQGGALVGPRPAPSIPAGTWAARAPSSPAPSQLTARPDLREVSVVQCNLLKVQPSNY